jgi:hypothetical protein
MRSSYYKKYNLFGSSTSKVYLSIDSGEGRSWGEVIKSGFDKKKMKSYD